MAFSIEDRGVHNMKEKRKQRSKLNNPTYKAKLESIKSKQKDKSLTNKTLNKSLKDKDNSKKDLQKILKNKKFNKLSNGKSNKKSKDAPSVSTQIDSEFMGEESKPGTNLRMRSIKKIREQAMEHLQTVKNEKKRLKKQKNRKFFKRSNK